jgi:hypothetical protein
MKSFNGNIAIEINKIESFIIHYFYSKNGISKQKTIHYVFDCKERR